VKRVGIAAMAIVASWSVHARAAGSLTSIAPLVARDMGDVPTSAIVVAAPLSSDVPAPHGDELAARVALLVAGKLGASAHPQAAHLDVARALAGKKGALVYLQVEIARGEVRVVADLYPVMSNAWDRVRAPAPAPRSHAFASAPIDAEVRTFLAPIVLEQLHVHKSKHDRGDVLAAACGDIDGDGGMEVALVSRTTVAWGHLRSGRFVVAHQAPWSALAQRAPVPFREPLATAAIASRRSEPRDAPQGTSAPFVPIGGELFAGLTDRGGVALSRDLLGSSPLVGLPIPFSGPGPGVACVRTNPALVAFDGPATGCGALSTPFAVDAPATRYDTFSELDLVGQNGQSRMVVAAREPTGALHVKLGDETTLVEGVGAQMVLADLDEDGVPEVVTTADSGEDAIVISSLRGGELHQRARFAAPGGVRSLAVCPPEELGVPALVAVVGGEVWVVR